jgi:hypothetical protein
MTTDPRDQLWDVAYETWYDAFFQECLSEALIARWLRLDEVTKVVVALTSGSSALAGLALWKDPTLAWLWPTLSGLSAVLAIITERLAVTYKLRAHSETMRAFASLRLDMDTLRARMRIDAMFDVAELEKEYLTLRKRFGESYQRVQSDVLDTPKLREAVQADLNTRIK